MGLFRLLIGLPFAAVVTVGLFIIMQNLVGLDDDISLDEDGEDLNISITRQIQETDFNQVREFERPDINTPPPPPPNVTETPTDIADVGAPTSIPNFDVQATGTGFNPDRDAQPLVRIEPQYPDRCQGRADTQETVLVEFDVTPDGSVVNPRVVDSTNSCFNRTALRAVERWKYQPKVVDGEAVGRTGVVTQFSFALGEE